MSELFPMPKKKETCWVCEKESDELKHQDDGTWLCPACQKLKICLECGAYVDVLYHYDNYDICIDCVRQSIEEEVENRIGGIMKRNDKEAYEENKRIKDCVERIWAMDIPVDYKTHPFYKILCEVLDKGLIINTYILAEEQVDIMEAVEHRLMHLKQKENGGQND